MATEHQSEALARARNNASASNYATIYAGFAAMGITDIQPRVNVFTYAAWKALGRQVKRGEHGVKVCTWIDMTKKNDAGESESIGKKPRMTTVFHVSQTSAIADTGETFTPVKQGPEAKFKFDGFINKDAPADSPPAFDYYSDEFTPIK